MGRGSQRHCGEATATASPGLGEMLVSWGCIAWPLPELRPPLCPGPVAAWVWPLIWVQNTPAGRHACYQALCDPGEIRNRHWFTYRKVKLLVQPASSFYATGEWFDELPGEEKKSVAISTFSKETLRLFPLILYLCCCCLEHS